MNLPALSAGQIAIVIVFAAIVVVGITISVFARRRRTEAALDKRAERVEALHIRPLAPGDRARFVESWTRVQTRFVDSPGSAVTDADQLLGDVMSTRGYPMSEFEQRAADISADHPLVLDNYRAAHRAALRQTRGQASTENLRQAMIHFRTLFEELVHEPEAARP